jgi:hypothetical protein
MIKERYQTVLTSIWKDEKFTHFDADTKLMWLYLLTCPHSNMLGLFYLPKAYIASDLGRGIEGVSIPLGILVENGLIEYDEDSQMILLVNNLKHRRIDNKNMAIGAAKVLDELPETILFKRFSEIVEKISGDFHKGLQRGFKGVSIPLGIPLRNKIACSSKPLACSSKPLAEAVSRSRKKPLSENTPDDENFNQFWEQYPRHEKKKNAFEAFKRINPQNGTFEKIMESLSLQKMSEQWTKDNGKFIPHPTTWLNGRRWEDELNQDDGLNETQRAILACERRDRENGK